METSPSFIIQTHKRSGEALTVLPTKTLLALGLVQKRTRTHMRTIAHMF
jgi:hypothetical protein